MSQKNSRLVTPTFARYFEKKFDESGIDNSSNSDSSDDCDKDESHEELDVGAAIKEFNRIVAQQTKVVSNSFSFHQNLKKEKNVRTVYVTQLLDLSKKNAEALIAEEEKDRQKAEKKEKKKKRKEKKKEVKENDNSSSKTSRSGSLCNGDASTAPAKKAADQSNGSQNVANLIHANADENDNIGGIGSDGWDDDDEAFLDPNSAFVSKAVSKKKLKASSSIGKMEQTCNVGSKKGKGSHDSLLMESEKLVREGCILANKEQYAEAVTYFTNAIRLVNNDHCFYNNRSFCYCQLNQFNKALKDAERSIELAPQNPKGFYRKAEALRGLKQYKQAETAYLKVLQLDKDCEDAKQDIEDVKVLQLMEMGFEEASSRLGIQRFQSVQAAIEELTLPESSLTTAVEFSADELYFSDEDNTTSRVRLSRTAAGGKDIKMDHSNPEGLYSLWVGNITQSVTEKQLLDLFARYGAVQNVRLLPEKFCAFINFRNQKAPGQAMMHLQGTEFAGARLLIRFPDTTTGTASHPAAVSVGSSGQVRALRPVNGAECYYWRTTGCAFGDKCRLKHLKESRGVDLKTWHKNR